MVNLLWTGGWDSTYRLLDLVLVKKKIVQPYYILDEDRPSTDIEIKTMKKIKEMIFEMDITADKRILNTITVLKKDIESDKEITKAYERLLTKAHLGGQYDWLARFAKMLNLNDLELSIHKDDKAEYFLRDDVFKVETNDDLYFKTKEKLSDADLFIFSYFSFPLLELTKLEMEKNAQKHGFKHIMEETWFCHMPTPNGKPCGWCNPCRYTREEGLGRRVPPKYIGFLNAVSRRLKSELKVIKKN
jgi:hypothetical protein